MCSLCTSFPSALLCGCNKILLSQPAKIAKFLIKQEWLCTPYSFIGHDNQQQMSLNELSEVDYLTGLNSRLQNRWQKKMLGSPQTEIKLLSVKFSLTNSNFLAYKFKGYMYFQTIFSSSFFYVNTESSKIGMQKGWFVFNVTCVKFKKMNFLCTSMFPCWCDGCV